MLNLKNMRETWMGIADKTVGLFMEFAGTLTGSDRLKDAGRDRQDAGTERLYAVEEEVKSTRYAAEAEGNERRQRTYQDPDARRSGRRVGEQASAGSAVAESVKGTAKKAVGTVIRDEDMRKEGDVQQEKAHDQGKAAKHEARAEAHREKADVEKAASERRAG